MTEKENLQLAHKALAAINAHDIDGYLKLIDDAYVGESEITGIVRGREGARQSLITGNWDFLGQLVEAAPQVRQTAERLPYMKNFA